jgi:hypothetical protein
MDAPAPTPAPTSSVAASCYPSPPVDNSIDIEESIDVDDDSDELGTDTQDIRSGGGGGRPPLPRNKRRRNVRKTSVVWNHFTRDPNCPQDKPVAHCNYCGLEYKCHGKNNGTSNMLYHVKACQQYKNILANRDISQSKFTFECVQNQGDGGSCKNLMITKYSEKIIRETLCEMIIVDEMPFSTVDRMGFKKLCKVLEPRFKLPSRYTLMKDCVKLYMQTKDTMKIKFSKTGKRVCLTIDTWTSIQNMNYMCITGHLIDPSWKYQKIILAFRQVSDHKGLTIARELEQCLEEWGIRGILTISLDNASANETAVDCFKKRTMANDDVICCNQFIHVRCCAYIINLIVHEGLKDVDDSIVRVRNMVKYIKGSPQRLVIFKSCAERKTSGYHASLTLDVPTRWNSTYMMLDVAEKYEMAFELMLDEDLNFANYLCEDGGGRKGLGPPLEDDWKNIRNFSKFLQVFYEVTVEISGSLYSTSNIYFNILQKVYNCLMEYCDSDDYLLSSMAIKMKMKYDKY